MVDEPHLKMHVAPTGTGRHMLKTCAEPVLSLVWLKSCHANRALTK
jgi:hypothetical protein